jgi:hypothetical protein
MKRILEGVRTEDFRLLVKHVDNYKILALSGLYGDVGRKPLTAEVRAAEVHPLFIGLFLYVAQRVVSYRLELGSSSQFREVFYRERTLELYKCIRNPQDYDCCVDGDCYLLDNENLQWNYHLLGESREYLERMIRAKKNLVCCMKKTGPVTFNPGRSFWPDNRRTPVEKYRFKSLWSLFKTLLRTLVVIPGTPYYRAAVMVLHEDCSPMVEAVVAPENFWRAIVARRGEFSWATCNYNTE